ncbi:unnamed protein product [Cuscuta campestris]|uniref:Uncharacterized protein n=1 Tax=Cuscuta campestris TaxID=132261 RepID=A0A484M699_9ASTE|nr:unnamed protein product [Cuscuta campestris]
MSKRGNRSQKQSNLARYIRLPVLTLFFLLLCVSFVILFGRNGERSYPSPPQTSTQHSNSLGSSSVNLDPTVEIKNGTDLIWQIPENPKAVLFLAHGCNGKALNFWDKNPNCPNCVGLPEERLIVMNALSRKFAVLAISSARRCWSFGEERRKVKYIINWWVSKQNLEDLPLVALGASSGGYFVSLLATDIQFSSIVLMIAEGLFDRINTKNGYPPTLFVHMPRDGARKLSIERFIILLKGNGVDVGEIECWEFPLSPEFLAGRVPGLNQTVSVKLFELFQEKGFVDKRGYMRKDGRSIQWDDLAVKEMKSLLPDMTLVKHIQEEMNLAYGYHEMTSLQSEEIFNWFESHLGRSVI